jgi:hypothetical protein
MTLPADIARCAGFGPTPDHWLDECHDCQRRTAPGGEVHMEPPAIIVFFCEYHIPPDQP